ncbi:MAG: TolC family protein [Pseudomonadota bacterium]
MPCLLPLLLAASAALAEPLSLRAALEEALRANPELRQDRLVLRAAELAVEGARASFDPAIWAGIDGDAGGSADEGRDRSLGLSAGLSQPLPSGGSAGFSWYGSHTHGDAPGSAAHDADLLLSLTQPLLDGAGPFAARYAVHAAERNRDWQALDHRATREHLVVAVASAYWRLVEARETLGVAHRTLATVEQQLEETRERMREGFAASGDVLQVERAVLVARQARIMAEATAAQAELHLLRLLGRNLERRAPLEPTDRPEPPEHLPDLQLSLEIARAYNAAWLQQDILAQGASEALRLARHQKLPTLDLTAGLSLSGSGADPRDARAELFLGREPASSMGLTLSAPLPGRADAIALDQAWLESQRLRLAREAAAQTLTQAVEDAVRAVYRDDARASLARDTVAVAQAALEADQELAREGRGSTREVVRSLEALDTAQVASLQADIALQRALLDLLEVEGLLLTKLGLEEE